MCLCVSLCPIGNGFCCYTLRSFLLLLCVNVAVRAAVFLVSVYIPLSFWQVVAYDVYTHSIHKYMRNSVRYTVHDIHSRHECMSARFYLYMAQFVFVCSFKKCWICQLLSRKDTIVLNNSSGLFVIWNYFGISNFVTAMANFYN